MGGLSARIFGMALLALPTLAQAQAPRPQNPERETLLANQSGQTIREVYAGDNAIDLLGAESIADRGTLRLRLGRGPCAVELRAIFADGSEERRRANLCEQRRVTFGDPAAPLREVLVRNATERALRELYVVPAASGPVAGTDRLSVAIAAGEEARLRLGRTRQCSFDLRAVFDDESEDVRRGVDLCRGMVVTLAEGAVPRRTLAVANIADAAIQGLYAIPETLAEEGRWGPERLGGDALGIGRSQTVTLRGQSCRWNLRVVYDDGTAEERRGADLCATPSLSFDGTGAPRPPQRRVVVVNAHRADIEELYLAPSATEDWGPDRLSEEVLARGGRREIVMRGGCEADLRIVFPDRQAAEERNRINLCQVPVIVLRPGWTLSDRLDAGPSTTPAPPAPGSTRLRNTARVPLIELYVDAPDSARGPDRLGATVLGAGETLDLMPPDGVGCRADLLAMFRDGREVRLPNTDLCGGEELNLP
ncbi:hypothetical protein GXW71_33240 [Roseomonas hellenica]|uniref:Uncharacterized protein n=1 Tax=Plastoroseomonas hellenica TaxID=2687306 RepID=A0ABS5F9N5_9PROT|nr:hypothetical protein [Plastoroseomonas hellenica]MBR0669262.1 hypothetical protein [Plastoroseomonas hellenica]